MDKKELVRELEGIQVDLALITYPLQAAYEAKNYTGMHSLGWSLGRQMEEVVTHLLKRIRPSLEDREDINKISFPIVQAVGLLTIVIGQADFVQTITEEKDLREVLTETWAHKEVLNVMDLVKEIMDDATQNLNDWIERLKQV